MKVLIDAIGNRQKRRLAAFRIGSGVMKFDVPNVKMKLANSSVIISAIERSDESMVKFAIDHGLDVNVRLPPRWDTMLHVAAKLSDARMVALLLAMGADVDPRNEFTQTPLHEAAGESKTLATMDVLLQHGANVNARNRFGSSVLIEGINGRPTDVPMVRLLLSHGADLRHAPDDDIMENPFTRAVARGNFECLKVLVDAYGPTWVQDRGASVLFEAAQRNHVPIIHFVLEAGVHVDCVYGQGGTALMHAASFDCIDAVGALLDAGADPSCRDWENFTAWRCAMVHGYSKVLRLLHERGAVVR